MKPSRAHTSKRIFLFSTATIVFCLLSIMVPSASERQGANSVVSADQLSLIDQLEPEANLEFQDWMLNFHNE